MVPRKIILFKGRTARPHQEIRLQADAREHYAPGRSLPGGFVVDETIGEGGSGLVLKAHKPSIRPPIYKAIKVINTRYLDSERRRAADVQDEFYGEAKVSHEIGSDPYAVSVEDIIEMPDGSRALVYPFIEGKTLSVLIRDHLRRGWLFPTELAAYIFHRILSVLTHARERGIAHRDLCANNIMVQRTGIPLVLDWGAASEDESVVVGKPGYMAPELVKETRPISKEGLYQADIFSLGALLREMVTGYNALEYMDPSGDDYNASEAFAFRRSLDTDSLVSVSHRWIDVPTPVSDVIDSCMKEDPDGRPDAEDLYEYMATEYLYTPQVGFGPTVETVRDYLAFFYGAYAPSDPLPENRLGRNMGKLVCAKYRRAAERPAYHGVLIADIAEREGAQFTAGSVGRTFGDAFGPRVVEHTKRELVRHYAERQYPPGGGPMQDRLRHQALERLARADGTGLDELLRECIAGRTGAEGAELDGLANVRVFDAIVERIQGEHA